ncbi:MAG: TRAM domain-containing protein [Clostridia bacterium]|nr:TRAM domain-containing protein [Clostridia bacterium]
MAFYRLFWVGRSECGRTVHFACTSDHIGQVIAVKITAVTGNTLCGEPVIVKNF